MKPNNKMSPLPAALAVLALIGSGAAASSCATFSESRLEDALKNDDSETVKEELTNYLVELLGVSRERVACVISIYADRARDKSASEAKGLLVKEVLSKGGSIDNSEMQTLTANRETSGSRNVGCSATISVPRVDPQIQQRLKGARNRG